jgi:peptidyl-tRNA hydrolase
LILKGSRKAPFFVTKGIVMSRNGFTDPKQVIVARLDLKMPPGKLAAQVAHASVAVLLKHGRWENDFQCGDPDVPRDKFVLHPTEAMEHWMKISFPKAVLEAKDEMEMEILYAEAQRAGLPCSKVIDSGRTVYNGEHNLTCIAIGPAERSEIDKITGHLPLYKGVFHG